MGGFRDLGFIGFGSNSRVASGLVVASHLARTNLRCRVQRLGRSRIKHSSAMYSVYEVQGFGVWDPSKVSTPCEERSLLPSCRLNQAGVASGDSCEA